jgi:hypothetical protein
MDKYELLRKENQTLKSQMQIHEKTITELKDQIGKTYVLHWLILMAAGGEVFISNKLVATFDLKKSFISQTEAGHRDGYYYTASTKEETSEKT